MPTKRKLDAEHSQSLILDTTERLMIEEGYAAVSSRRVAAEASLKPPLVHYYFRTTDELFLAVFRRASDKRRERIDKVLTAPDPLRALWKMAIDPQASALTTEFNALANHRKNVAAVIAQDGDRFRATLADGIDQLARRFPGQAGKLPPIGLVTLLLNAGRSLVLEQSIGMKSGQDEAMEIVEFLIDSIDRGAKLRGEPERPIN